FDESFGIALDFRWQPFGARFGADHGKNGRRSNDAAFARLGIFQFDFFQLFRARHFADLGLVENLDVAVGFYPTRKVVRHLHTVSPNEKKYFGRALRKEHRRLAGRIAAAGDNHSFVATKLTFQRGGSVISTYTFELFAALGFEPAIIRASRNEESFRAKH